MKTEPGRLFPGRLEKKMFRMPTEKEVQRIRTLYPAGTRVELISMDDPYTTLKPGDQGSVVGVEDAGQIMMKWDNGSTLSLIPGEDSFRKV